MEEKYKKQPKSFIGIIKQIVCKYRNTETASIYEKTRKREIVQVRQEIMFFSKQYTKCSLAIIGEEAGGKDHATVLHACKTINNLFDTNTEYRNEIEELNSIILEHLRKRNIRFVSECCGTIDVSIFTAGLVNINTMNIKVLNKADEQIYFCNKCKKLTNIVSKKQYLLSIKNKTKDILSINEEALESMEVIKEEALVKINSKIDYVKSTPISYNEERILYIPISKEEQIDYLEKQLGLH